MIGSVLWQVDEGRDRWRDFPPDLNAQTEEYYNANGNMAAFQYVWKTGRDRYTTYVVDFESMRQGRMVFSENNGNEAAEQ